MLITMTGIWIKITNLINIHDAFDDEENQVCCKTDTSYSKTGSGSALSYPDAAADAEGRGRGDSVKAAKFLDRGAVVDGYPSESVS